MMRCRLILFFQQEQATIGRNLPKERSNALKE